MVTVAFVVRKTTLDIYSRFYFKNTYIEVIDTPSYGNQTKEILQEFNALGDNKIISFTKIKNGRPVQIREMTSFDKRLSPYAIGMARPLFKSCTIVLRSNLDYVDYRETVLHEYLHCMGYAHSLDKKDLMYFQLNPVDKEDNIKQYAKEVLRKFYE
jgi:hypothetical protein